MKGVVLLSLIYKEIKQETVFNTNPYIKNTTK